MKSFDITIIGGGMVGLALAASFAESSLRIAVIESHDPYKALQDDDVVRVSAIHRASENYLKSIKAWPSNNNTASAYLGMEVWEKDRGTRLHFDADELHQSNLGHIVENQALLMALWQQVTALPNVSILTKTRCSDLQIGENEAWLSVEDEHGNTQHITSKLMVGADGANSWLRNKQNMPLTQWDYEHHAIVGHIRTEQAHESIARQIFTPQGPIALLPLNEPNLCSLVCSNAPDNVSDLMAMESDDFNKALSAAFDMRLGLCKLEGKRQSFPLKMRYARDFTQERVILIGDAAHTIHPLAGQGVNLGLMDAASLAQTVLELAKEGKDFGQRRHLRPLERWRKTEATKMIAAMQGFKEMFASENPIKKALRGAGMDLVEKVPFVKTEMMKRALGVVGKLPERAKGN